MSQFVFGKTSQLRLRGVHPDLVQVTKKALELTVQDFSVVEGVRTAKRQQLLRARGASKVQVSRHQRQEDGFGHAVDLVPYIAGVGIRWELDPMLDVCNAMSEAALSLGVRVRWGGSWTYFSQRSTPAELMQAYIDRRRKQGRTPFIDAWHFEVRL